MTANIKLGILGPGSVGAYVGGCLAANGADVRFVGRSRTEPDWVHNGVTLTDMDGRADHLPKELIHYGADPTLLNDCDVVFVTVKSGQTMDAAAALIAGARPGATIVSLQNGLSNGPTLAAALPDHQILRGMIPMNIVWKGPRHIHCATGGQIAIENGSSLESVILHFASAGLSLKPCDDIEAVQWGKLLMNLNNAINTVSGLSLRDQLSDRIYRRCLALAQQEAIELLEAEGTLRISKITGVPAKWMPTILRLPNWAFGVIASRMLKMDSAARSSMADDLAAGRAPEVDWINGEIVALASRLGLTAPVNACLCKLVYGAFSGKTARIPAEELIKLLVDNRHL